MTDLRFIKSASARAALAAVLVASLLGSARAQTASSAPNLTPAKPAVAKPVATAAQPASAKALAAKGSGDVVARVGDNDITADELRAHIAALGPREQAVLAKDPVQLSQIVRMLLANQLVFDELVEKKWDQRPEVVNYLTRVRESALVEFYLQSVSTPPASYPGEDELQKVYDANRAQFLAPRQYHLSQIFIARPKNADKATEDKARKKLDEVQKKLKSAGVDFGAIAGENSDAKPNVDLGMIPEAQIVPEIRSQVVGLAKGAVSDPILLDDGWHILKLIDTRASYTLTLPEVRDQLAQQMRKERAAALRRAYLFELLKQHPPVLNELALSNLLDSSGK